MEVVVAGGGIGGLASAAALARIGVEVTVLEQAAEFGEIGAGLQLAPNALRVLRRLGLAADATRTAVFPKRGLMMDAGSGEQITSIDFGETFRERYGYPYVVMHRSDLLALLLEANERDQRITLRNGSTVAGFEDTGRRVRVWCTDGSTYEADALVGADGLWSVVRQHVVGDGDPVFCGDVAYRGTVPIERVSAHAADSVVWWIGPGIHLIQYPLRGGALFNQVAVFASDRRRSDEQGWGTVEELEERFAGTAPAVAAGLRLINRDRRWILHDRDPIDNWTVGRVTLLGDAAHPMLQYLAQGACQALEDAVVLADALRGQGAGDVLGAFRRYQAARLPRTTEVQRWARRMGEIVHADGVAAVLRNELLRRRPSTDYRYVDWLYSYGDDSRDTSGSLTSTDCGRASPQRR